MGHVHSNAKIYLESIVRLVKAVSTTRAHSLMNE